MPSPFLAFHVSDLLTFNMVDRDDGWTFSKGAQPIFWSVVWPFTCLVVVSFPNYINRWTGVSMVLAAAYCSWQTATDLSPDGTLNEIYTRYILIGTSHCVAMAYKNPYSDLVPNEVRAFVPDHPRLGQILALGAHQVEGAPRGISSSLVPDSVFFLPIRIHDADDVTVGTNPSSSHMEPVVPRLEDPLQHPRSRNSMGECLPLARHQAYQSGPKTVFEPKGPRSQTHHATQPHSQG